MIQSDITCGIVSGLPRESSGPKHDYRALGSGFDSLAKQFIFLLRGLAYLNKAYPV